MHDHGGSFGEGIVIPVGRETCNKRTQRKPSSITKEGFSVFTGVLRTNSNHLHHFLTASALSGLV
jgi:hypothetical protein